MKNLKVKKNSIIVLLLMIVIFYFLIKDNFNEVIEVLRVSKIEWLLVALIGYLLSLLIEATVLKMITNKYKKNYSLKKAFDLNIITKFFNGITPSSSGGQPFQIYSLTKENIKVSNSTNIVMEFFLVFQISLIILSGTCYAINMIFNIVYFNSTLTVLFYVGLLGNIFTLIIAVLIGRSKKVIIKILSFITFLLNKIKLIKNKDKQLEKIENVCIEFYNGYKELNKNKMFLISCIFIELLAFIIRYSISIFIFKAFNVSDNMSLIECLVASIFTFLSGSCIPIPGGSGGMEYAYYNFFGKFIKGAFLSSCLILWRLITYIIPILLGGFLFSINTGKKRK